MQQILRFLGIFPGHYSHDGDCGFHKQHSCDHSDVKVSLKMMLGVSFSPIYTHKNTQVVTGLQTSCYKSVHKLCSHCCNKFGTSC